MIQDHLSKVVGKTISKYGYQEVQASGSFLSQLCDDFANLKGIRSLEPPFLFTLEFLCGCVTIELTDGVTILTPSKTIKLKTNEKEVTSKSFLKAK